METVKSSPLKAAPNGLEPTSPEALAALAALVEDTYGWFKGLVKERRGYDDAVLATVSDGRIFTGKQALDLKLIDEIGDENTAVAWLEANKSVPKNLDIEDWEKSSDSHGIGFARMALASLAETFGLGAVADMLRTASPAPGALDGLISVWQPRAQN